MNICENRWKISLKNLVSFEKNHKILQIRKNTKNPKLKITRKSYKKIKYCEKIITMTKKQITFLPH